MGRKLLTIKRKYRKHHDFKLYMFYWYYKSWSFCFFSLNYSYFISIQVPVASFAITSGHAKAYMKEGDLYILTAYFTDPETICSGVRKTTKGYTGDSLYLVMNNGPVKIPLKESAIRSTQWTKGKCFYGMGNYSVNFSLSTLHICVTR